MILLDSNILIYAASPLHQDLTDRLETEIFVVSLITIIEVLGYHKLHSEEKRLIQKFINGSIVTPVTDEIANKAIELRQQRKTRLGDSIIAATALVYELPLMTRNENDFKNISALTIINPLTP